MSAHDRLNPGGAESNGDVLVQVIALFRKWLLGNLVLETPIWLVFAMYRTISPGTNFST